MWDNTCAVTYFRLPPEAKMPRRGVGMTVNFLLLFYNKSCIFVLNDSQTPMPFHFHPRLFITLSLLFIAFVIGGTLLHECGHYAMAKWYGHKNVTIHYNYMSGGTPTEARYQRLLDFYDTYEHQIDNDLHFPGKAQYEQDRQWRQQRSFWITAGGPLQTLLTGTIGLLLMVGYRRKYYEAEKLRFWQWLLIMVTLFWMRPLVNLCLYVVKDLLTGKWSTRGDEIQMAQWLGWPEPSVLILTAIVAVAVLLLVLFRYIPMAQRFTFLCAAVMGGGLGYALWMYALGPIILP